MRSRSSGTSHPLIAGLATVGLVVLAGCGLADGEAGQPRRPDGYATLRVGGSVSAVPTSSPKVVCIRAITAALRATVEDRVPPRRAAADLAATFGPGSDEVRAFSDQLATYRGYAADRGAEVAGTLVWPALEAACT